MAKGFGSWRPGGPSSRPSPYGDNGGGGEEITTLWVGDLPGDTGDNDLLTEFVSYGQILSAKVSHRVAASGARSGFVRFHTRFEADQALSLAVLGQLTVLGQPVSCQWARSNTTGGASGGGGGGNGAVSAKAYPQEDYQEDPFVQEGFAQEAFAQETFAPASGKGGWPSKEGKGGKRSAGGGGVGMGANPSMGQGNVTEELATLWVGSLQEGTGDMDVAAAFGALGQVVSASVQQRPSPMGSYSGFVRFATRHEAEQALALCSSGQVVVNGSPCSAQWAKVNSKIDPSLASYMPQLTELLPKGGPPDPEANPYDAGYAAGYARGLQDAAAAMGVPPPQTSKGGVNLSGGGGRQAAIQQGPVRTLFIGSLPPGVTQEELAQSLAEFGVEGAISLNKPSARGLSGFIRFPNREIAEQAMQFLCETPLEVRGQQLIFDWAKSDTRGD